MSNSSNSIRYAIIIPAYNPDEKFVSFVKLLRENGEHVIAVNDGSIQESQKYFTEAEALGCTVLIHEKNCGKGKALRTGFAELIRLNENGAKYEYAVTADCDGQHSLKAIRDIVQAAAKSKRKPEGPALVIGGRFKDRDDIPLKSKIGNNITRWIFKAATGISIHDTQTGLRAVPERLFKEMLEVRGDRYEYEMNMLLSLKSWDVPYVEIPIETIYYDNNSGTHFHPFRDSFLVISQILKYICSSLISFFVDYVLFFILSSYMRIEYAYALARVASGLINYFLNAKVVFGRMTGRTFVKYIIVWIMILSLGSFGGRFVEDTLKLRKLLCKIFVDLPLFFVSYFAQKHFVFKK